MRFNVKGLGAYVVMGLMAGAWAAPVATPATRGYVTTLLDQEMRDRLTATQALQARLLSLESEIAVAMAAIKDLADSITSNEFVQAEVATNFVNAVTSVTNAMRVAEGNITAFVTNELCQARVRYASTWGDKRVTEAHVLLHDRLTDNRDRFTDYTLQEEWPLAINDGYVRQYLAVVQAPQNGTLEVPSDYLTDLDVRLETGYNLIMITDLAQFRFLQVRGLHKAMDQQQ